MFELISSCIDNIYDEEQIYNDFTKDEVNEFIENLPQEQFKKISDFFSKHISKHMSRCTVIRTFEVFFLKKVLWGPMRPNIRNFCYNSPSPTIF